MIMAAKPRTPNPATPTLSNAPADAAAWRAVEDRDARYDGRFVYAVRSTGVYCRPSCPSRRPARGNVRFFGTPDAAEAAGYRECRRCTPRATATRATRVIHAAVAYLDAHAPRVVSLGELAAHVGVSAAHLQRAFTRAVGVSPRAYQDARRVRALKARLRAGDTVSRATYEAGFGSSSRVYERADAALGMTPAEVRRGGAGVRIRYAIADSPRGRVLVGFTARGVCAVELGATDADVERGLRADFPRADLERCDDDEHAWVRGVVRQVTHPRDRAGASIPLDMAGTAFQARVWKALRDIPAGERRSYGEIARAIGRPTAARAVARACATNRIAVLVPCHRVVREDGATGGYKWGLGRKQRLLDDESA